MRVFGLVLMILVALVASGLALWLGYFYFNTDNVLANSASFIGAGVSAAIAIPLWFLIYRAAKNMR